MEVSICDLVRCVRPPPGVRKRDTWRVMRARESLLEGKREKRGGVNVQFWKMVSPPPPTNKIVYLHIHAVQLYFSAEMQKEAEK